MIRIFNVYYPARSLVLIGGELLVVCTSFLLAVWIQLPERSYVVLNYENGFLKILGLAGLAVLCSYYFDLYDLRRLATPGETYFRLLLVLGTFSFVLAAVGFLFPAMMIGPGVYLVGLSILTFALLGWRSTYGWMIRRSFLRERVYILGAGERAQELVSLIRSRPELGMDVVGWAGAMGNGSLKREELANAIASLHGARMVDRVIVAMTDRRGTMPVRELLELRLKNVRIEEATALLEKINGKMEVDDMQPSWLIFGEGFRLNAVLLAARRLLSTVFSLILLVLALPLFPLIALAVKLTSPGPLFYKQKRVGRGGKVFNCYKFRTMRSDAEADTGPTWAGDDDPRITAVGRFLRRTRLDEIPQLLNVLIGDMNFVGPRPERPEFVEWLTREIPYYQLRHIIRPGITGWAQICYEYGASVEQAKEKLKFDLYYIKHLSVAFDLYIVFQTVKIVLFGRGAK